MVARHKSDSATTETKVGTSLVAFENQRDVIVTCKRITGVNSEPNKRTLESPNYDEEVAAIHRRTQINDKPHVTIGQEQHHNTAKSMQRTFRRTLDSEVTRERSKRGHTIYSLSA
ncbi:unnamed protein product [Brassica oleracea]